MAAYGQQDALLKVTKALSNGAGNVTSDSIDLGHSTSGRAKLANDLVLSAPALTTTQLPDTETMKYELLSSANSDLSSATSHGIFLTQTGAGGAGAAATTAKIGVPTNAGRYIGFKATKTGTGDASTVSATMAMTF